jgi:hypothetical protein
MTTETTQEEEIAKGLSEKALDALRKHATNTLEKLVVCPVSKEAQSAWMVRHDILTVALLDAFRFGFDSQKAMNIGAIRAEIYKLGFGQPPKGDYQIGFNDALQRLLWVLDELMKAETPNVKS